MGATRSFELDNHPRSRHPCPKSCAILLILSENRGQHCFARRRKDAEGEAVENVVLNAENRQGRARISSGVREFQIV